MNANRLLLDHWKDIQILAKLYCRDHYRWIRLSGVDHNDLASIGALKFLACLTHYDPSKSKISTYIKPRIVGAFADYCRATTHSRSNGNGNGHEDSPYWNLGVRAHPRALDPSQEEHALKDEFAHKVRSAIMRLNRQQRLLVQLIYYEDKSQRDATEIMGLSHGRVSKLHNEVLLCLRKWLR